VSHQRRRDIATSHERRCVASPRELLQTVSRDAWEIVGNKIGSIRLRCPQGFAGLASSAWRQRMRSCACSSEGGHDFADLARLFPRLFPSTCRRRSLLGLSGRYLPQKVVEQVKCAAVLQQHAKLVDLLGASSIDVLTWRSLVENLSPIIAAPCLDTTGNKSASTPHSISTASTIVMSSPHTGCL
jgi:hypothetical protein